MRISDWSSDVCSSDLVQVWRLTTEDGQSLLGRLVPAPLVPKIATAFGVDAAITITPAEAVAHVLAAGEITAIGAYRLKRSLVAGQQRPELIDWPAARLPELKAAGGSEENTFELPSLNRI